MRIDNTSQCEHIKAYKNAQKLIGLKCGMLTIKDVGKYDDNKKSYMMICDCDCGNKNVLICKKELSRHKKSCGCLSGRNNGCTYRFEKDYVIGDDLNHNEFIFDLKDYNLVKDINWHVEKNGYVRGWKNGVMVRMHNIICGTKMVDHINHNKNDNRRCNLRITTYQNNSRNHLPKSTNKSGVTGVHYSKQSNCWVAQITVDGKNIHLGKSNNFEEAIKLRKDAENKYFGEYSFDNSMKIIGEIK